MAQLFAFYEYPTTIALTYSDADKSQETLNWTDIKNHTVRHTIPGSSSHVFCMASTESHQTIGRLCRQLGELLESTYKSNSTSTDPLAVLSVAEQLGFTLESSHWKTYNDTCTLAPLGKAHPLFIIGYREDGAGHIWLVDGSIDMRITKVLQLVDQETKIVRERQIYNHVNWGWDGKSNGYILSSIFDTSKLYQADHSIYGSVGSNSNFKNGLRYAEVYTTLPPFVIH